ncbi:MAG: calcium-translocating P-type ATPase, PMCA-type [Peptococcaceae bacterium]|nr:calcium-translocating P-type ATPase, PMCA-type [Peptococcaceae bacterium]
MKWHSEPLDSILKELGTDIHNGLSTAEATARLEKFGPNKLKEKPPRTFFQRFREQMKNVMIGILMVAAVISLGLSIYNYTQGLEADWIEPIVIVIIVLLNAVLGVVQESKAEAALEALKKMTAPQARVLRNGQEQTIPSAELVPGDIVLLEAGDFIPADCRLINSASLKSDEAALTGESVPAEKEAQATVEGNAPLGDRFNMIYSGCALSYGRCKAVVVETGMKTEMGKIASMLEQEGEVQTPLQLKLAQLGKYLGLLALGISIIIFIIGVVSRLPLLKIFMTAVALAVAAIPEGLPAIVTIVLAIGVQRMVAKNAIIRRLPAVETLGSTSVICSDKTGTLTQNRMTLVKAYAAEQLVPLDGEVPENIRELIKLATLCTDGTVEISDGEEKHIGDPTETSIVAAALKLGLPKKELTEHYPRLAEIPFDSERKLMTTVNRIGKENIVIVKGAPDILLERCIEGDITAATEANQTMAKEALRVIAVGTKSIPDLPTELKPEELEQGLKLVGLVGMIDPPRPEVLDAIQECNKAGIRTIMITGDHVVTASAIAKQLGIMQDDREALTGTELAALPEQELAQNIRAYRVYARVTPTDKIRIVKAWQKNGQVVAMTGDGVNDAPALKAADIGCAMGITGTDVAKGTADMILTDDNFATIVTAVREGRGIYDNIRKAVHFLLSCNLGEIVAIFIAMLVWRESTLLPIQLLWINLITDSLPALALGVEPIEHDVMNRKPRAKNESIFAHGVGVAAILQGLMIGLLTLVAYYIGSRTNIANAGLPLGETMAFAVLAIAQLVHSLNIRSSHSLFKIGFLSNKYMVGAFLASLTLMLLVLNIPFLQQVFDVISMGFNHWLIVIGLSLIPLVVMELVKLSGISLKKINKNI